jgi:hypothetical protein
MSRSYGTPIADVKPWRYFSLLFEDVEQAYFPPRSWCNFMLDPSHQGILMEHQQAVAKVVIIHNPSRFEK